MGENKTKMKYPVIFWEIVEAFHAAEGMTAEEIKYDIEAEYQRKIKELKREKLLTI